MRIRAATWVLLLLMITGGIPIASAMEDVVIPQQISQNGDDNTFVANNIPVGKVFDAVAEKLGKPVILSQAAAKKKVTGNFSLARPTEMFKALTRRIALIWYDDGASIYVYDSSEMSSQLIRTENVTLATLKAFIQNTGIYDARYPLRAQGDGHLIYVAGPPLYVELIHSAARYLDRYEGVESNRNMVLVPLKNSFVNDRSYSQRGNNVVIPGMVSVLRELFTQSADNEETNISLSRSEDGVEDTMESVAMMGPSNSAAEAEPSLTIVGYPNSNTLLLKGDARQVAYVRQTVAMLDSARRQIELSLWIIDISRTRFNDLGVRWQAGANIGGNGVIFNNSTINSQDSFSFLAKVNAISREGDAQIVSRPLVLTQENVPALFDNNTSFYTRVEGERVAALEQVTYGTMISVLPRIAENSAVEMEVDIEDGNLVSDSQGASAEIGGLPVVNRTNISTVARIPETGSLLIGGYTRTQKQQGQEKIPLLGDIPLIGRLFSYNNRNNQDMIRVFLIRPRLLGDNESWDGSQFSSPDVLTRRLTDTNVTLQATIKLLQKTMR